MTPLASRNILGDYISPLVRHPGDAKTLEKIQTYWWPTIKEEEVCHKLSCLSTDKTHSDERLNNAPSIHHPN
jgi:hypothetical protein